MRILFILHETGEHSGAWKSARLLLQGLKEKQIEIKVLTPDKKEVYSNLVEEGYDVKAIKIVWDNTEREKGLLYKIYRIPFDIRRNILGFLWMRRATSVIKEFRPDIIHSNSSVFYLGYDLAKKFNIPHIWHIREYGDLDFGLETRRTQRRLNERFSYNIFIANDILEHRGLKGDPRSCVIYNGIMPSNKAKFVLPKSNYFLYVGSLGEGKGIRDIIDAWLLFKQSCGNVGYTLKVAGGYQFEIDNWTKYIKSRTKETVNIEFLGMRNDVDKLMCHAKALIIASYSEAFGRVTAEGMFNGALVIGRDTAGTKEQFDNGIRICGREIALRFNDVNSLKRCLCSAAALDEQSYSDYVLSAQSVVKELYSTESCVNKVANLYRKINTDC